MNQLSDSHNSKWWSLIQRKSRWNFREPLWWHFGIVKATVQRSCPKVLQWTMLNSLIIRILDNGSRDNDMSTEPVAIHCLSRSLNSIGLKLKHYLCMTKASKIPQFKSSYILAALCTVLTINFILYIFTYNWWLSFQNIWLICNLIKIK